MNRREIDIKIGACPWAPATIVPSNATLDYDDREAGVIHQKTRPFWVQCVAGYPGEERIYAYARPRNYEEWLKLSSSGVTSQEFKHLCETMVLDRPLVLARVIRTLDIYLIIDIVREVGPFATKEGLSALEAYFPKPAFAI